MFFQRLRQDFLKRHIISLFLEQRQSCHRTVQCVKDHSTGSNTSTTRHPPSLANLLASVNQRAASPFLLHSTHAASHEAAPDWTHDEDVHVESGLSCADCHKNGIEHHTVRGFDNETHPTGQSVATLTCRGCHLGAGNKLSEAGGRFAAPKPLHKGLPAFHFDKMACTVCHCGPIPGEHAEPIQTALAHELGLPGHREENLAPAIVTPVFKKDELGVLHPYRMTWPAFWGMLKGDKLVPLNPEDANDKLRRVLRVRRDFAEEVVKVRLTKEDKTAALGAERADVSDAELTEAEKAKLDELTSQKKVEGFQEKLAGALKSLAKVPADGTPVYVSGGKAYRLNAEEKVETFTHSGAEAYAWPLAHDVRPANQSLGVKGCWECHSNGSPIFFGTVTAVGPAPDATPTTTVMHEIQEQNPILMTAWNLSFLTRPYFKVFAFAAVGVTVLVFLLSLFLGLNGLLRLFWRKPSS